MAIKLYEDDKESVLPDSANNVVGETLTRQPKRASIFTPRRLFYAGLFGLLYLTHRTQESLGEDMRLNGIGKQKPGQCAWQPQAIGKGPGMHKPENYTELVIGRLSRAVQIPTVSYDDMGPVEEDPRWKIQGEFGDFLEKEYERVYATLEHTRINTYAHLYTWNPPSSAFNPALKPIVLMAHQDVVPVNPTTENEWDQAPFGGVIDTEGGWVWGRGAADCKNQLMGILSAVDKLIEDGFEPDRPILIAFGFDEEIGGKRGADYLSAAIEEKYGKDSVAFLVDEGFGGVDKTYGRTFASIGMAEKGSLYLVVTVETPGGHSSVPPVHTGIGFLAQAVAHLEAHPFKTQLTHKSPYLRYLNCLAEYAPDLPHDLRKAIKSPHRWNQLARDLSKDPQQRAFLGTTQAVDLIKGGVKGNALPERAEATVNYRIDFSSSVQATKDQVAHTLKPLAKRLNLEYIAFNETLTESRSIDRFSPRKAPAYAGRLRLEVGMENKEGLEPAPITPSDGLTFELLGGTIKKVFGEDVIVAPSAMFANTDTRAYWNLTKNLYRFAPAAISEFKNPHTVNERMSIRGHLSTIEFFYQLLQNSHGQKFDLEEYGVNI